MPVTLYFVVPCYNEEEALEGSAVQLLAKWDQLYRDGRITDKSRIVLINDGSRDQTGAIMHRLHEQDERISCLHFSSNFGHQSAVLAGYLFAADKCDAAISIDADLQQDINAVELFLDEFEKGVDVVYGVRNSRSTDGFFKKATSQIFYGMMKAFGSKTIPNHADYRLLSKRALKELAEYGEGDVFLRGLIPEMGFASAIVHFDVKERTAGQSKYTLKKMLTLAMAGITSFSIAPIHYVFMTGVAVMLVAVIVLITALIDWATGNVVSGYTTIVMSMWFLGALQLMAIGIVGEYIGKNYIETKKRPRYIIEKTEHR